MTKSIELGSVLLRQGTQ